jgi:hypothetical protein
MASAETASGSTGRSMATMSSVPPNGVGPGPVTA